MMSRECVKRSWRTFESLDDGTRTQPNDAKRIARRQRQRIKKPCGSNQPAGLSKFSQLLKELTLRRSQHLELVLVVEHHR